MKRINVTRYKRRGYAKKKLIATFFRKLLRTKPRNLKKALGEAEKAAWKEIDCTSCGSCCMEMTPTWKKSEIKRVAAHVGMTSKEFYDKWLYTEEETGDIMNYNTPCQFFDKKNGLCTIYEIRPHDCATFPHLYRRDFDLQEETYRNNLHRCPATLVAMEHLYNDLGKK